MLLSKYNTSNLFDLIDEINRIPVRIKPWTENIYPQYNMMLDGDNIKRLEIVVTGFSKNDIEVYREKNLLIVKATVDDKEETKYYYNGIIKKSFKHCWSLSDNERVDDVKIVNGILLIDITTIAPEKPKRDVYSIR